MTSRKSGPEVKPKWPGRESHLSTDSESDVNLTVDSNLPLDPSTRKSPSAVHVQAQQVAPPNNRPKKDITFEEWNPMEQDYNDKSFNNYNRGPAAGLSGIESGRPASKKIGKFSLFVGGLPTEMTEEGLSNLFSHVCDIQRVKVCEPRDENSDTTFGFVDIPSVKDGEEAIRRLDGHVIRNRRLKVSFKKEKERTQVEVSHSRQEPPEEWDPPPAKTAPTNWTALAQRPPPKAKAIPSRSTVANRSSSGGSEAEGCNSERSRKPPQPRKLEDRYGSSSKPKSSGEESKVKSVTGSVQSQKRSPVQEPEEPPSGGGRKKIQSPLQVLLQKMKSPNKNEAETVQDKTRILASIERVGQKIKSPAVKGQVKVNGRAGSAVEREIDLSKSEEEATSDSSLRQAFTEKLRKAGIIIEKESQPSDNSRSATHPASKMGDKLKVRLPLSLGPKGGDALMHDNSDGKESGMPTRGQSESPSTYKAVKQNEHDGILGLAPQVLIPHPLIPHPSNQAVVPLLTQGQMSQPHSPVVVSSPSYCADCAAHEYHEIERHGGFHPHPNSHHNHNPNPHPHPHPHHPHHHHHSSLPRSGPHIPFAYSEGYPMDEPCLKYHHHIPPFPYPPGQTPPLYAQGPHYGPAPPYGGFQQYSGGSKHSHHYDYPGQYGHYEERDTYRKGYPPGNLGSARYRNSGYQSNRSNLTPGMRGKPEPPASHSKISTKSQKAFPPPEDHHDGPAVETAENPSGDRTANGRKGLADKVVTTQGREPAAGNQGVTTTQHPPAAKQPVKDSERAKEAPTSALPKPRGEPIVPKNNPAGKSMHNQRQPGPVDPKPCMNCGKAGLLRCGQCKCTYCSKDCQRDHWPTHKHQCRKATSPEGTPNAAGKKTSPTKPPSSTPPRKATEVLHSGTEGHFMARNLPFETPDRLEMEVIVTEVGSPSLLWVQIVQQRSVEACSEISSNLNTVYIDPATTAEFSYIPKVGGVCAAKYTEDGNWYRAEVVSIDNDRCTVCLIDFGTMDAVSKGNLRKLQDNMLKFPKQALRCSLSGVMPPHATWSNEATRMIQSLVNKDEGYSRTKFKGQGTEGREIEIYSAEDRTKTISSILIGAGLAQATSNAVPNRPSNNPTKGTPAPPPSLGSVLDGLTVGMHVDICVSHVESPDCFYANLVESAGALVELDQKMNERYADMPQKIGFRPRPGELCAARFSENNLWYRAVTHESSSSIKKPVLPVTFVDYGNSEDIDVGECRPLEASLATLSRQVVPCGLAGVRPNNGDDWPEEMTDAFREWLVDGRTCIVIKSIGGNRLQVDIFSPQSEEPDISFNALLKHFGFGISQEANQVAPKSGDSVSTNRVNSTPTNEPKTGGVPKSLPVAQYPQSEFQCFVTVANDPCDFYLQVDSEENRDAFRAFSEHLNTRYALQDFSPYTPNVGEVCAAVHTDDAWYRVRVMAYMAQESAFRVLFVDYGNVEVLPLDRIRQLEDRFYKMPVMALHCSLTCVIAPSSDNKGSWNEAATRHFTDKVLNKRCQVSVVTCEGGKHDVKLLYPGKGNDTKELTSVKRDLIKQGWALPKDSPSPNHVRALGSGDHKLSNHMPAVKDSPDMNRSGDTSSANRASPQSASANQSVAPSLMPELPTEDFFGLVTAVGNHGDLYLQVVTVENAEAMQSLTEDLYQHYTQTQQRPHKPRLGELCAVQYSIDNAWYRARVVGLSTNDSAVKVLFVDFGNIESVNVEEIQKLEERFMTIPLLALHCHLSCLTSPSGDQVRHSGATEHLNKTILDKSCKIHVTKHDEKVCEVEIHYSIDDISWLSVNDELIEKGLAKPIRIQNHSPGPSGDHRSASQEQPKKINPVVSPANENEHHNPHPSPRSPGDHSTPNQHSPAGSHARGSLTNEIANARSGGTAEVGLAKLPDGEPPPAEFTGVLTSVNHPCDFYLQIKNEDYIQLCQILRKELNTHYCRPDKHPHVPRVGELCAAMYSADSEWYRAVALEHVAPESAFKVMFVDYGNCEVVPMERLQKLEGDFLDVPRLSHRCCLSGVMAPSGDKQGPWSVEAASYISTELIERDKDVCVKLVKHDGKVCEVELLYSSDDGKQDYSLKDELLRKGLARPFAAATSPTKEIRVLASSVQKAILPPDWPIKVMVNDVVSPREFYCQMVIKEEIQKLQSLMEEIRDYSNKSLTAPPAVGDLCLAKFTADDDWYRAEILKIKQADKRALVHYIDFGNKEPLPWSRLGTADSRFALLPMQAIRCGLSGFSPNPTTDEKTKAFLREFMIGDAMSPKFLATLCGNSADGTSLVQLVDLNTGEDVNQIVQDYFDGKQTTTSPGPSKSPGPTLSVSPATSVVSPRAATSDPARLEALKREMELKKKTLEAQIEAQRRELAEVELLRASLEQGL